MKELIVSILREAIGRARAAGQLTGDIPSIGIEAPRDPAHGDVASNIALTLAKPERKPPRAIAEIIKAHVTLPAEVSEVSVAGLGFINFRMSPAYWHSEMRRAASAGRAFWKPRVWELRPGAGKKVQVEFLSANPTGPVTVGHGRNAVLGDTIARLYEAAGFDVTREYYFNDGGRQMKLLGESVRVRYLQAHGIDATMPEEGYQGEYIVDIARVLKAEQGDSLVSVTDLEVFRLVAVKAIFADINQTCTRLGIRFDVFTNELDLFNDGKVAAVLKDLHDHELTFEQDGAIWLRGEPLGLPKDAVLVRSGPDRQPTYRTPDIAYHIEKLKRGFDLIVGVFGADHIAEHQEVIAAVKALGYDITPFNAIIYQFVTLTRGGEKIKMSTRKATYVTLDELIDEVGADVVRFFFLFRKSDSQLDFDLELAKKQAPENPVFYVQYAHARLASIFREGAAKELALPADTSSIDLNLLGTEELDLAKRALGLPDVMSAAAETLEPHRIPFYLLDLAGEFHRYYNKPANRIIGADRELSLARMFTAAILKDAIAGGLELLGVSAPERM
ncbi:MAG TPA: arginine--tRNA ligase [Candidatus Binatus sp.]|uniref:arginine--tRNA ligase n=1 Tax=Candidatus Binatus sp. TaxID=2811406 RepID=UPI002B497C03|nr:arginine--tRNA ligase [Candidatus Binatus sp.]HKN13212.1 arginine--tRNA ligase [Candidatus Binatus sp.]